MRFLRGGQAENHSGGRGGQKISKTEPRGLWMPLTYLIIDLDVPFSLSVYKVPLKTSGEAISVLSRYLGKKEINKITMTSSS